MASMEDYTDGLRASLNQRMEHALNDNMVKVSDILSKTHAQMVADLTDPREWYYSDVHKYLIDLLHISYSGSKRNDTRFQTNPTMRSVDNTLIHAGSDRPKVKGHNNLNHPAVERNTHAQHKREKTASSKESCFDGTDAMRRYKRQKALARNSKTVRFSGENNELRDATFAEGAGKCFLPTHQRPTKVAEKQPTDVNELTIIPTTAAQERSLELTATQNSEVRAPTKQTKIRKFVFPPEAQEKSPRHASEVVVYDRWIQHIAGDKSLPNELRTGIKKNDRNTRREKSIILKTHTNSKSTQTENEVGSCGGKVELFSIPLKLSPNSGLHERKRPHTSALNLKSSQGSKVAKFVRAGSPRNDTNFQSLLDNAKKRLAEIEKQIQGLCIESGIIRIKPASTNDPVVRESLPTQRADAADNLPGEDGGFLHGKTNPIKTVDVGTITPSEWYTVSKPLTQRSSDMRTGGNVKNYVIPDQPNTSKSQHSRYHRHVSFTKSALTHPAKLVRPQKNQRWNTQENRVSARQNGTFPTTSELLAESLVVVDTSVENAEGVIIPSAEGIRHSPREEELKMLLRTSSLRPSLRKQTVKSETSPEKEEFDEELLASTASNNSSFTHS